MIANNNLEFTGERFTPECVREIWYEHYHRYAFSQHLVQGKNILDAACGEGYGSNVLAATATQVTGVDIDAKCITHAQNRYQKQNLKFVQGSCTLLPFADNSFDVVISFETLEHLAQQTEMLAEFNRVLHDDGIIIISTPDKKHYSDASGFQNEFHVKELYQQEFKQLLDQHWQAQTWYAQAMQFHSVLEKLDTTQKLYATDILTQDSLLSNQPILLPMYYIVIASKDKALLPVSADLHLFADAEQSVYQHYNKTIKDFIYLANQHNALIKKHEKWLSMPILGKILKYFYTRDT
ncbi:MAG: class I SAM-dependent methyltransferase [Proteobacteria bacterium]|nr:class I SAM-dependent methyltransferase [Pseudomonadota bacterium]